MFKYLIMTNIYFEYIIPDLSLGFQIIIIYIFFSFDSFKNNKVIDSRYIQIVVYLFCIFEKKFI